MDIVTLRFYTRFCTVEKNEEVKPTKLIEVVDGTEF